MFKAKIPEETHLSQSTMSFEETSSETTPSESTPSVASTPEKMISSDPISSSSLDEDELRTLFLIVQQSLDLESLRTLYDLVEQEFPDELETAHESLDIKAQQPKVTKKSEIMTILSDNTKGCYLYYDDTSGKLKLVYSETTVDNAIGFYSSRSIPGHKYRKNFGRADLMGGCFAGVQGRKNYYSGLCQFIRAARSAIKAEEEVFGDTQGQLWIFPRSNADAGINFDIYVYDSMAEYHTIKLPLNKALQEEILDVDAVTCLPKHSDVFEEVKKMALNVWLVRANNVGATVRFNLSSAPTDDEDSPRTQISLVDQPSTRQLLPNDDGAGPIPEPPHEETVGCYLLYDASSCKLKLQYSKTPVRRAIGFYCAGKGKMIRGFKFTKNFGRADLIGNCAAGVTGRKNYYSGWCQFIRAARAVNGPLWIYPRDENSTGLDVDMYVYYKEPEIQEGSEGEQSKKLELNKKLNISEIDAIACLPKHSDFFSEIKRMDLPWWLTEANNSGATSKFE
jgi:hypothetical protein